MKKLPVAALLSGVVLAVLSSVNVAEARCGSRDNPCIKYVQPVSPVTINNAASSPAVAPAPVPAQPAPNSRVKIDAAVWGPDAYGTATATVGKPPKPADEAGVEPPKKPD